MILDQKTFPSRTLLRENIHKCHANKHMEMKNKKKPKHPN